MTRRMDNERIDTVIAELAQQVAKAFSDKLEEACERALLTGSAGVLVCRPPMPVVPLEPDADGKFRMVDEVTIHVTDEVPFGNIYEYPGTFEQFIEARRG